ncbi:hypothetical protein LAROYE_43 [Arthrobacter phage Laroye]|uniref:Uncharacterized protein n=1 Tax=Arthrobacter phage Laroye TaxID=1772305 RepID=A0A0U4JZE1_9CAUD|nr:hypothetical protein FDH64_gp43 [Arthrobacter phage Laroye]ALY09570.1 hypothetical protein LAROYE_43 [Arthrobacter phage Laroye]
MTTSNPEPSVLSTPTQVVRAWGLMNRHGRARVHEIAPHLAAALNELADALPETFSRAQFDAAQPAVTFRPDDALTREHADVAAAVAAVRPDNAPAPARFNVLAAAAGESGWEAHPEAPADTPDGATELVTVDWAIVKATGQVLYYFSEVEARRAYRTEHGRKIMVRIPGGHMWRVIA